MTKVQLTKLEKLLYTLAAVFALVAIIMIVGASVKPIEATGVKQKIDSGFFGYDIIFGLKDGDIYGLKFSFLALLPYLFAIAGLVLLVFRIIDKFVSRKFDFLIAALFLIAAILYFLSNNFIVYADNLVGELYNSFDYRISYGTIISGTLSVLAGGLAATNYILEEFVEVKEAETQEKQEMEKVEEEKLENTEIEDEPKKETKKTKAKQENTEIIKES